MSELKLVNCNLSSLTLLEDLAIYNERIEVLDLSQNQLSRFKGFFKNLQRNWFSKLTKLVLAFNHVSLRDLEDFCEIFEVESRAFERLLFVLRVVDLRGNPLVKTTEAEAVLSVFYLKLRKTLILN